MHTEIPKATELAQKVVSDHNEKQFSSIALEVYHFQFLNNPVYQDFCRALYRTPDRVQTLHDIPFLPISFFKTHRIEAGAFEPQVVFKSSGTTGSSTSIHYVKDARLYETSFFSGFERSYGKIEDYCILGLLPSYLERGQSSLVYMVDHLIKKSGKQESGFYLHDFERLNTTIRTLEAKGQKTVLMGVTFALLEFGSQYPQQLQHCLIMETGGMKGRRREMTRHELYDQLKSAFGVPVVHSEYGMTELLSQAYAVDGLFSSPPWMKVFLRDETDPLSLYDQHSAVRAGAINIIDLANLYSCSFLATEDMGRRQEDGRFEVLGRLDHSDIRGCSLMVTGEAVG